MQKKKVFIRKAFVSRNNEFDLQLIFGIAVDYAFQDCLYSDVVHSGIEHAQNYFLK